MKKRIIWSVLVVILTTAFLLGMTTGESNRHISFNIDAKHPTKELLPNIASNINVWQLGNSFVNPTIEFPEYNEFGFVK